MYGFIGGLNINSSNLIIHEYTDIDTISRSVEYENFVLKQNTLKKFVNDKVFFESKDVIIAIEGVIYNYKELCNYYKIEERGRLLEYIYINKSLNEMCDILDGYYSGIVYDKKTKEVHVLTDHIGYRPIWYYYVGAMFLFSTDINWLYKSVNAIESKFDVDEDALVCLLNFGYILGDRTIRKNIKKVLPGHYLTLKNDGTLEIEKYYSLPLPQTRIVDMDNVLYELDNRLTAAVKKSYEKDAEYGYKHIMPLSGGLDSRTLLFKACQLGYETTCITMGEANCADIRIASQICNDLKKEHLIYELNNGLYLSDIDSAVEANGGNIMWPGFAHGYRHRCLTNLAPFGAIHSGDCGDIILGGSLYEGPNKLLKGQFNITRDVVAYGKKFEGRFSEEFIECESNRYENQVLFNYYNRGVNSAGNGVFATQFFTEGSSPFMDRGVLDLMYKIPYEYTKKHKCYFEYLKKYMPEACNYVWEHSGCKPGAGFLQLECVKWKRRFNYRILHRIVSMNPYDKWYRNNVEFRSYLEKIYGDINFISGISEDMISLIRKKYSSNSTIDKTLACVAIRVLVNYGLDKRNER